MSERNLQVGGADEQLKGPDNHRYVLISLRIFDLGFSLHHLLN